MKNVRLTVTTIAIMTWLATPAQAGEAMIAVAANFTAAAKEIGAAFKDKTGDTIKFSFGSTGKLYTQISQGAPYDAFLAADVKRPARAVKEGYAVSGSNFTYAVGKLVLWSQSPNLIDRKGSILKTSKFKKIAIANPVAAPYGAAAVSVMQNLGVYAKLKTKIVEGNNISQAHQFVATQAADLGFVSGSQVALTRSGSKWLVPDTLHAPIYQNAVLLRKGQSSPTAQAFLKYLRSPAAANILKKYGYGTKK